jgi:hypothetical protein
VIWTQCNKVGKDNRLLNVGLTGTGIAGSLLERRPKFIAAGALRLRRRPAAGASDTGGRATAVTTTTMATATATTMPPGDGAALADTLCCRRLFSHVFSSQALLKLKLGPSLPVGYNPPRIIPFQA